MNRPLHIDFETRSTVDLRATNAYVYFEHPSTDVWLGAWAFGDDEPQLWIPPDPCPAEIRDHILRNGCIAGWNVAFERLAMRGLLSKRHGWPLPKLEQYRCTMVKALSMALPGKLEHAAPALGLDVVKDQAGHRLMLQMSRPRKPKKGEAPGLYWWDDPEKLVRLGEYCKQDVRTEQAIDTRVLPLSALEQEYWFIDQEVNDRGVYIDEKFCHAAKLVVAAAEKRLNDELRKITDFRISAVSNTGEMATWIRQQGFPVGGVAKDDIEWMLNRDDLPKVVRRVCEIRQEGGKASVRKIDAMLARRQADGRMRGNIQFNGAATGRDAGRGAQLQNLPRPSEEFQDVDKNEMTEMILGSKDDRLIEAMYGNTLTVVADSLRGAIKAPPGHSIIASDFASIESRVNAWLAGEDWKLKAFADFDAGVGHNMYCIVAAGIFNRPVESITKKGTPLMYQGGKVGELSLGYQGGPGALAKMAKNYKFDVADAYDAVMSTASPENKEKAKKAWLDRGKKTGMTEIRWIASELIKLGWRDSNPAIVQLWKDLETAAIEAVQNPGKQITAGKTGRIAFKKVGSFLFCKLPSPRALVYPFPQIIQKKMPWKDRNGAAVFKDALQYKGTKGASRKWRELDFYGGLSDENGTQATARDVMKAGQKALRDAHYPIILPVHDEVVSEPVDNFGSEQEYESLLLTRMPWMNGLPLAAETSRDTRYRK